MLKTREKEAMGSKILDSNSLSTRFHSLAVKPSESKELAEFSATTTEANSSSSSGSTIPSRKSDVATSAASSSVLRTHSGELPPGPTSHPSKPGHRRSSSASSFPLPAGNICPSGRIGSSKPSRHSSGSRPDILGSGSGNYGHGSIVRGGSGGGTRDIPPENGGGGMESAMKRAMGSLDAVEVRRIGNEEYRKGHFGEALRIYDRAVAMCPENAACRSNRAAALVGLGRLGEAVRDCKEAVRIDPGFGRAHQRLASIYVRMGQVENAQKHLFLTGQNPEPTELQKLQSVGKHLANCADVRKIGDWKSALRETDAAIAAGADSSPLLIASRADGLLHLHQLDEAESAISHALKLETSSPSCSQTKFFGMLSDSYIYIVRAQGEKALGRFENAVALAEKARQIDPGNAEITMILNNVRSVARARAQGNELFNLGKFLEACIAYGEGLKYDPSNSVLYCNRAACRANLGQWERSIEDCNEALNIQPYYTKALLRRAASNGKLELWAKSVQDYEVLRKELPDDMEVAEALFHAQVALKTSRGEDISNMKFGGEVELIYRLEQFRAAISLPGVSVVHFMVASNEHCMQITPFVDILCNRYPSVNFLKVDVNESPDICKAENVRAVPTFKIYKNGTKAKEMICPPHHVLEFSVKNYLL